MSVSRRLQKDRLYQTISEKKPSIIKGNAEDDTELDNAISILLPKDFEEDKDSLKNWGTNYNKLEKAVIIVQEGEEKKKSLNNELKKIETLFNTYRSYIDAEISPPGSKSELMFIYDVLKIKTNKVKYSVEGTDMEWAKKLEDTYGYVSIIDKISKLNYGKNKEKIVEKSNELKKIYQSLSPNLPQSIVKFFHINKEGKYLGRIGQ